MRKIVITIGVIFMFLAIALITFFCLFPNKYKTIIDKYSQEYEVPKYLITSVINIESNFKKDEISSVGAIGLMQIMPSTAFDMASRLRMDISREDLFDEEINIKLGTYYLAYLLEMFNGNIINTLSAYNWGLNNVKNWIMSGNIDEFGNVTNIPIEETKNYIKKYNVNKFVYKNIYRL